MLQSAWIRLLRRSAVTGALLPVFLGGQIETKIRTIQVRAFNVSKVPRGDLVRAESEVSRILAPAGITITWFNDEVASSSSMVTDFSAVNSTPSGCRNARRAGPLSILLLPHVPRGLNVIGFSLPCAEMGADSVIYIDKCEQIAFTMAVSFSKVLSHALAHELGHLLLRSNDHSATGLMRPRWDRRMWQLATAGAISLDREEARRINELMPSGQDENRLSAVRQKGLTPFENVKPRF